MGYALDLVNNFKVENVIFNYGEFNELEQDLINVLEKKKIPYYSCVSELNLDVELLGDMVKESGVDTHIIEEVKILSETPYEDLPEKAKERLGIEEHEKNILVRIVLRSLERTLTNEECNNYRDIIYRHISTKEGYLTQINEKN